MNELIAGLNAIGRSFVDIAAPMLIQSSILIVVLMLLNLLLRRRVKAVIRYGIWLLVLAKLMLPPSLAAPTSLVHWIGARWPSGPQQVQTTIPETPAVEPVASATERPTPARARRIMRPTAPEHYPAAAPVPISSPQIESRTPVTPGAPAPNMAWQTLAFLVWLVIVFAMTLLLIQRAFFVRGLVLQSEPAPQRLRDLLERCRRQMGVHAPVQLRLTAMATSPSVAGLRRPKILIPQRMLSALDEGQLKSILLHELAHIKRGDLWISLLQTLLQIVYFFHPLLWLANLMIRRVREQAVDETVLAAMGDEAEDYPRTLLNVSRLAFGRPALSLRLLGVVESKRALTGRIKHIASRPFPKTARLGLAGLILIATVAAILLPMARAEKNQTRTRFTEAEISTALASLKINPDDGRRRRLTYWEEGVDLDSVSEVPVQTGWPVGIDIFFETERRKDKRISDFVAVRLGEGNIDAARGRRILTLKSDGVGAAAAELLERLEELRSSKAMMNGFYTKDLPTFFAVLSDGIVSPAAQLDRPADPLANAQSLWLIRMTKARAREVEIELWQGMLAGDTTGDTEASSAHDRAEAPPTRTIHGVVTDTLGRPRQCAYVAPQGRPVWKGVMSDAQGRFTLENVTPDQKIWMAHSQASQMNAYFRLPETIPSQPFRVTLNLGEADLAGRVVGADGKALADRKVELVTTTADGIRFVMDYRPKTDAYGYYAHEGVPCGDGVVIEMRLVDTNDAVTAYSTGPVKTRTGQVYIEMPLLVAAEKKIQPDFDRNLRDDGMFHCRGRVVDEDDRPIAGARVHMSFDMPNWSSTWIRDAMTDDRGRWHRAIPPECMDLSLEFDHPEYHVDEERRKPSRDELAKGTHRTTMKRGLALKGKVVNERGHPVENALVCANRGYRRTPSPYNQIIEDSTTARTRKDGFFRIGGLPPGTRTIAVYSAYYAPTLHPIDIQSDMTPITVTLAKGRTYRGRLLDAKGQPIQDARIGVTDWQLGKEHRDMSRLARTDAQGNFALTNLPEGQIGLYFGKKSLMGFRKDLPKDLSSIDELVMHEVPVFTGRVVDAETGEPIPEFSISNGVKWRRQDASPSWSRRRRRYVPDPNGLFTHRWGGYGISYPLTSVAYIRIQAPGYLPAAAPPLELGQTCEPQTIRLRKGTSLTGTVLGPDGSEAGKAQVAFVEPGEMAFIDRAQFSARSYVHQAQVIETADDKGRFELPPTEGEGLVVAVHKSGYAQAPSIEFTNGGTIRLTPWARIEGVIDRARMNDETLEIALHVLDQADRNQPGFYWLFDRITPTGDTFVCDFLPAVPVAVGRLARFELNDGTYLAPQPGRTYSVAIGPRGRPVTGRIDCPSKLLKEKSIALTDPRQTHAVAFQTDGPAALPAGIGVRDEDSFKWLWRNKERVYTASQTARKRFVPEVAEDGQFTFAGLNPGVYELVVNIHAPLGENVSCGRGVLEAVAVSRFTVPKHPSDGPLRVSDIPVERLMYPGAAESAPLFEATTLDGKPVRLEDLRGKVVLLDFWATWCSPCVAQLPKMQALHKAFADREDFMLIGLSLDWDLDKARRLIDEKGLAWPQICLGSMDESLVVKQYGVGGIPMTVLIDADGTILARGADAKALKQLVAEALGDKR